VLYVHSVLGKAFRDGVRMKRLTHNPVGDVEPPTLTRHEYSVWGPAQVRKFLEHVRDDRLYAAWRIFAMVGPRRGEVAGLQWSGVDFERGTLRISQTMTLADNKIITKPRTKTGRPRIVSLDTDTVAGLRAWGKRQKEERLRAGEAWQDTGRVFTWEDGSVVNPERWSDWFSQHARDARLPRIRLHDLRHSAATAMLAAGLPTKLVSDRLGHSNTATTTDIYQHATQELQAHTAAAIAAIIDGAAEIR
ncbi:MAG: site-specific integrase, partial [Actinobacteria bacterium]|nr:site-specific integrase [Actinomycetota bacterium]